jgi:hypothetical protein
MSTISFRKECSFKDICQKYGPCSNKCNNETDDYRSTRCTPFDYLSVFVIKEISNGGNGDGLIEKLKNIKF